MRDSLLLWLVGALKRILQETMRVFAPSPTRLFNEPQSLRLTQPPQDRSTCIKSACKKIKKEEESCLPLILHKSPTDCGQMQPYDPHHVGLMHCVTAVRRGDLEVTLTVIHSCTPPTLPHVPVSVAAVQQHERPSRDLFIEIGDPSVKRPLISVSDGLISLCNNRLRFDTLPNV